MSPCCRRSAANCSSAATGCTSRRWTDTACSPSSSMASVHLRSRAGQAYEGRYPQIAQLLAMQPVERAVLDGEVVALGPDGRVSFQRRQNQAADGSTTLHDESFD